MNKQTKGDVTSSGTSSGPKVVAPRVLRVQWTLYSRLVNGCEDSYLYFGVVYVTVYQFCCWLVEQSIFEAR